MDVEEVQQILIEFVSAVIEIHGEAEAKRVIASFISQKQILTNEQDAILAYGRMLNKKKKSKARGH